MPLSLPIISVEEIHGHVQSVVHILFESKVLFEDKWQDSSSLIVSICPDLRPHRKVPVWLPICKWRIREQGGGNRLQREGYAHFPNHVSL